MTGLRESQLRFKPQKRGYEHLSFLKRKGIFNNELIARFKLGFADRSLGLSLPSKALKEGKEIRSRLMKLGALRESGHEHFNGAVTFPICDGDGKVVQIYGKKINTKGKQFLYQLLPHNSSEEEGGNFPLAI